MLWIPLVLFYGLLKGGREIIKKLAMTKNTVMEVLLTYTFLSFVFVLPQLPQAGGMESKFYFLIAVKSFAIFLAWMCSFRSVKFLPVSLFGILDLSRVLFSTFSGVVLLGEKIGFMHGIGMIIVCSGLLLLKFKPANLCSLIKGKKNEQETNELQTMPLKMQAVVSDTRLQTFYVALALFSCFLNGISGFLDKVLMKDITSSQLQFWYMFFLVIYYLVYMIAVREKFSFSVLKNKWIWILAISFVIGDKALFIANGMEGSKITVMTLLKQVGCLFTILGGKFVFKEKNIGYKLFCAAVIIAGIVLGTLAGHL